MSFAAGSTTKATEADAIAMDIEALHAAGVAYRDIAILVRGQAAYPKILDALDTYKIPCSPEDAPACSSSPRPAVFGATYAWLADIDWAPGRFIQRAAIGLDDLVADYADVFDLADAQADALREHLEAWKPRTLETDFNVSLVGDFYTLLALLGVGELGHDRRQRAQPARHGRALHHGARRLRVRHAPLPARRQEPGRAGRR